MTSYPVPISQRAAKLIKDLSTRLRIQEQRSTKTATQANVTHANVNSINSRLGMVPSGTTVQGQIGTVPSGRSLQGEIGAVPSGTSLQDQVNAMQQQISNLFAKIGDPSQNGSGLTGSQSVFLATLGQMGNVGHPSAGDLTSTNTQLDNLLNELVNQNYMQ